MRVVLHVVGSVPGLTEALEGADVYVTLELADDEPYPVSVTAHLGPEAVDLLTSHASSLAFPFDEARLSPEVLALILRVLGYAPHLRVVK